MTREDLVPGLIVKHFKRELLDGVKGLAYLYEITCVTRHTETHEELVVYRALAGDRDYCARPLDMFLSEVDVAKYPNVRQKYRFEPYEVTSKGTASNSLEARRRIEESEEEIVPGLYLTI